MHVDDGELEWFVDLELALEFRGTWDVTMRQPPPCPVLCAECRDAPLSLEVYAVDPDDFRNGEEVAFDLVHSRFDPVESESCVPSGTGWQVQATGIEIDLPTQLAAYVVFANDAWYVLAFTAWEDQLDDEMWRVHAMTASAQFGQHKQYGSGVDGLVNLVGHHLADSGVQFGRSRSHLGFTRAQSTVRRGRPKGWTDDSRRPIPETDEDVPAPTITQEETVEVDPIDEDLAAFDSKLKARVIGVLPDLEPTWPRPWQPLPNVQPHREPSGVSAAVLGRSAGRSAREQEVRTFADGLPAEVALYAERIHGRHGAFGHRELLAFPVVGLDRIPVAVEAALRLRQGELTATKPLALGEPRRAPSRLARDVADGLGVTVEDALRRMFRDDDWTAYDLLGWELGWREIQARLPAFGLTHHSTLVPARARVLAFTDLEGPLHGMEFGERVEMWRGLDEDGRRAVIAELHKSHLSLSLDGLESAWLDACHRPDPDGSRARWSAALGPRGCALEYAQLVSALLRNEVLGMTWSQRLQGHMKPCTGDHLSGAVPGVEMLGGKLGQSFGALNAVGWLGPMSGGEVAMCILARRIETNDHAALSEQLRVLAGMTYRLVRD